MLFATIQDREVRKAVRSRMLDQDRDEVTEMFRREFAVRMGVSVDELGTGEGLTFDERSDQLQAALSQHDVLQTSVVSAELERLAAILVVTKATGRMAITPPRYGPEDVHEKAAENPSAVVRKLRTRVHWLSSSESLRRS